MKISQRRCPRCQQPLTLTRSAQPVRCPTCHATVALPAPFLSTFSGRVLFFSVSLLIGCTLPGRLAALGVPMQGGWRLAIDVVIGTGYYFACRWGYARWQMRKGPRGSR